MTAAVLGIDVGGTKLACGRVTGDGRLTAVRRTATPPGEDPETVWRALADLVDAVGAEGPYDAIGIGCGGPMRWPDGVVSPLNLPAWRGFPLLERVRARFGGGRPVRIHNDAVAYALGEARWGAGRGAAHVLGMVVSTGVGGGLVLGGRPVDGATGNAGHIGHVVAEPGGPRCGCGGRGCLEAVARGPAIAADAVARGWTGDPDAQAVAAGARAGDRAALAAYARAGQALGTVLAGVVALLDLEVVSVGGGVAQAGAPLWDPLRSAFAAQARLHYTRGVRVVPAGLGPYAGVVGAAALVLPPPVPASLLESSLTRGVDDDSSRDAGKRSGA